MTQVQKIGSDFRPVGNSGYIFVAVNPTGSRTTWVPALQSRFIETLSLGSFTYGSESTTSVFPSSILIGSDWNNPSFIFLGSDTDISTMRVTSVLGNNSGFISITGNPVDTSAGAVTFTGTGSVTSPSVGGNVGSFNIIASGLYEGASVNNLTIKGFQLAYWGGTIDPTGGYNQAFIKTLSNSGLVNLYPSNIITVNVPVSSYFYYAHRSSVTGLVFTDANSSIGGGFIRIATGLTFNNGTAFNDTFDIYRSDNHSLGNTRIRITQ